MAWRILRSQFSRGASGGVAEYVRRDGVEPPCIQRDVSGFSFVPYMIRAKLRVDMARFPGGTTLF